MRKWREWRASDFAQQEAELDKIYHRRSEQAIRDHEASIEKLRADAIQGTRESRESLIPEDRTTSGAAASVDNHFLDHLCETRRILFSRLDSSREDLKKPKQISPRNAVLNASFTPTDPTRWTPFRQACQSTQEATSLVEKLYPAWQDSVRKGLVTIVDGEEKPGSEELNNALDSALRQLQHCNDVVFGLFASALGVWDGSPLRFDKKAADLALKSMIGCLGQPGRRVYSYVVTSELGHQVIILPLDTRGNDARGFSLYLGRKTFVVTDPRCFERQTWDLIARLSTPRCGRGHDCETPYNCTEHLSPSDRTLRENALALFKRFCQVLFIPKDKKMAPARPSNSGKACLENSRTGGGKRSLLYVGTASTSFELYPADKGVLPTTILSAGKPRGITIAPARSELYASANSFMFARLRRLPCMVAGRTVESWIEDCIGDRFPLGLPEGWTFACGDGKSCTDYFDGRFADAGVDVLVDSCMDFGVDKEVARYEMKCLISRAKLLVKAKGGFTQVAEMYSGQLMASDFSFPFLCLVTLVGHLSAEGMVPDLLKKSDDQLRAFLFSYRGCGVNGDDIVNWGPSRDGMTAGQRWSSSFTASTGGIAEPAKSPEDPEYFTINSQLCYLPRVPAWSGFRSRCREVGSLLPSLASGLNKKSHKAPHESWKGLLESPLLTPHAQEIFAADVSLMPEFPVAWGGLGAIDPSVSVTQMIRSGVRPRKAMQILARRALWLRSVRSSTYADLTEKPLDHLRVYDQTGVSEIDETTRKGWGARVKHSLASTLVTDLGFEDNSTRSDVRITGWVDRKAHAAVVTERYRMGKLVYWSNPAIATTDPRDSYAKAMTARFCKKGQCGRDKCISRVCPVRIYADVVEAFRRERRGQIFVRDFAQDETAPLDCEPAEPSSHRFEKVWHAGPAPEEPTPESITKKEEEASLRRVRDSLAVDLGLRVCRLCNLFYDPYSTRSCSDHAPLADLHSCDLLCDHSPLPPPPSSSQ